MADSKITQLPLSPYALDKDLIVAVTGHLEDGAYPYNTRMPLSYIRRYVVRLNLMTSPESGISTYYHSGLNVLTLQHTPVTGNLMRYDYADEFPHDQTISTTGLNTIRGNNLDIQFDQNSLAALAMTARDGAWEANFNRNQHLGEPYHSGIISVTGLNAYSGSPYGNLVRVDCGDDWPFSGIISQTGLNSIQGNLVDVKFSATSEAAVWMHNRDGSWHSGFNKNNNLGNKYHSGIISITGLNAYSGHPYGNLIRVDYDVDQWPYSGVISQTGVNAVGGNHVEIQLFTGTDADFNYPGVMGQKYHSGVISTTGLNLLPQTTGICIDNHISQFWPHKNIFHSTGLNAHSGHPYGNNIRVDYDTKWPYSGIISQTGLNVIRGNLIDIAFTEDTAAATKMHSSNGAWNNGFSKTRDLGNKYHSGIISVTGLNIGDAGNRISYTIESDWPYKYNIDTTGLNIVKGNEFSNALNGIGYNIEPDGHNQYDLFSLDKIKHTSSSQSFIADSGSRTTKNYFDGGAFVSYCNIKRHKPSDSLTVLAELSLRLQDNCIEVWAPTVPGFGSTNTDKTSELSSAAGSPEDWEPVSFSIDNKYFPLKVAISISGNSVSIVDKYPITFTTNQDKTSYNANQAAGNEGVPFNSGEVYEIYRSSSMSGLTGGMNLGTMTLGGGLDSNGDPLGPTTDQEKNSLDISNNPYTLGANRAMTLKGVVSPNISSSTYNVNGCVGIKYSLTNPKFTRTYRKADDTTFVTSKLPAQLKFTVNNARYLKCESMEQAPTITFTSQPSDQTADDGAATFTSAAKVNDYTDLLYQWQEAAASTTDFTDMSGKNSTTLSLTSMQYPADNGKRYRLKAIAYDGITTSTSNYATLTTEPATLTVTGHPSDAPIPDDGSTSFSASASSNVSGTTIDKQWEVSTNGGSSYSEIAGQTSNTLNLTELTSSDDGNLYRCKFSSSGFSTVYSNAAKLWYIQISISSHPANLTIARGTGSFSVTASQTAGSPFTLYYRWERSSNGGSSFSYYSQGTSNTLDLTNMTYSSHDQNQWRVKVRLQGFSDDVETVSNAATLTVQEIDITSQPTANQINGKDMIITTYAQNYVPTTNGSVTLSVTAVARNSSATLNYQWQEASSFGGTYSDLTGKTSASLTITGLTQNSSHKFYKCLIDDDALSGSDSTGMERQTTSVARVTTSTFIANSNVSIDDNTTFASLERDGTSTVAETLFLQLCYDLTDGLGHTISVDAQADQSAQILVSGEISPAYTSNTLITHLEAVHPNNANSNVNLGVGTEFDAGDKINLNVLGNVNQFLCRLNVPLP
jgi:hypothetical protein